MASRLSLVADSRTRIVPLIVLAPRETPTSGAETYIRDRNVELAAVAVWACVLLVIDDEIFVVTAFNRSAPVVSVHVENAGVLAV
jgi:hypothetical protein